MPEENNGLSESLIQAFEQRLHAFERSRPIFDTALSGDSSILRFDEATQTAEPILKRDLALIALIYIYERELSLHMEGVTKDDLAEELYQFFGPYTVCAAETEGEVPIYRAPALSDFREIVEKIIEAFRPGKGTPYVYKAFHPKTMTYTMEPMKYLEDAPSERERDRKQRYLLGEDGMALVVSTSELQMAAHVVSFRTFFASLQLDAGDYDGLRVTIAELERERFRIHKWIPSFQREVRLNPKSIEKYTEQREQIKKDLESEEKIYKNHLVPLMERFSTVQPVSTEEAAKLNTRYEIKQQMEALHESFVGLLHELMALNSKLCNIGADSFGNFLKASRVTIDSFIFQRLKKEKGELPVNAIEEFVIPFLPIKPCRTWSLFSVSSTQRKPPSASRTAQALLQGMERKKTYAERFLLPKVYKSYNFILRNLERCAKMQGTAFSLKSFLDSLPQESPVDDYFFDFWIYLHAQRTLYMDHIAPEVLAMKEAAPDILSISCSLRPDVIGFQGHVISNLDLSVEWRT